MKDIIIMASMKNRGESEIFLRMKGNRRVFMDHQADKSRQVIISVESFKASIFPLVIEQI